MARDAFTYRANKVSRNHKRSSYERTGRRLEREAERRRFEDAENRRRGKLPRDVSVPASVEAR